MTDVITYNNESSVFKSIPTPVNNFIFLFKNLMNKIYFIFKILIYFR